jgi:hypothetical protein
MIEKSSFPSFQQCGKHPPAANEKNKIEILGKKTFPLVGEWQGRQDQSEEEGKTLIHHLKQERG